MRGGFNIRTESRRAGVGEGGEQGDGTGEQRSCRVTTHGWDLRFWVYQVPSESRASDAHGGHEDRGHHAGHATACKSGEGI